MGFAYPPNGAHETTAIEKIVLKAIPYLLAAADDPGERHEIATLLAAQKLTLNEVGDHALQIVDGSRFSRSRFNKASLPVELRSGKGKLPEPIQDNMDVNAKVMANGMNEVDFVFEYEDPPGTHIRVVTEAKSGGAASSGSQMNNYTDAMVDEHVNGQTGLAHEFYHCYESSALELASETVGDMSRFYEALCSLNLGAGGARATIINRARLFNPNGDVLAMGDGKTRMRQLLTNVQWKQQNAAAAVIPGRLVVPAAISAMTDAALAAALNTEFFVPDCHFKIGVLMVAQTKRKTVGTQVCKLMSNNGLAADPKSVWGRVYSILQARVAELP